MFNYTEGFMVSHKEEASDVAAKPSSMGFLVICLCMLAGRGKFILKIQPALLKLEFLDDSPDLSIQGFPAHISRPPPPRSASSKRVWL